jgi:hypothetical protein
MLTSLQRIADLIRLSAPNNPCPPCGVSLIATAGDGKTVSLSPVQQIGKMGSTNGCKQDVLMSIISGHAYEQVLVLSSPDRACPGFSNV